MDWTAYRRLVSRRFRKAMPASIRRAANRLREDAAADPPNTDEQSSRAHLSRGDFEAAEAAVLKGLALDPDVFGLAILYAEIAMARRDWSEALRRWQAVLGQYGSRAPAAVYATACRSYRKAGRAEDARAIVGRALEFYPKDVPLLVEWAVSDNFLSKPNSTVLLSDSRGRDLQPVEILICVHNAYEALKSCLGAIFAHTSGEYFLTVVDDYSDERVKKYVDDLAASRPWMRVIHNSKNIGYTRSANRGIKAARTDWVVLLNSDTIVTRDWLEGLLECCVSDAGTKAVGPLSNAATIQSIPEVRGSDGNFATNTIPRGMAPDDMAALLRAVSRRAFPRVPLLNGFCTLLHKPTISEIGYFDEVNFPRGYGEENDLCLRLTKAGHKLAIADHVYVHHAKTSSFTQKEGRILTEEAARRLGKLWTGYNYRLIAAAVEDLPAMTELRNRLRSELVRFERPGSSD